jgi:hypothetical protein
LAVVWAVKKYRSLLEDRPFTLRTDNVALACLDTFREYLVKWAMLLHGFQFNVQYVSGKTEELPDALSRFPGWITHNYKNNSCQHQFYLQFYTH